MASIRIVSADFYMNNPISNYDPVYSEFRSSVVNQVPIIRIFGSSQQGVKTCLHVHGVFPYVYIPYDGSENVNTFMYQLASNLDKALNISFNRCSSNSQHIFKILHVSGIPMYGYHHKEHQFLKLYFYNPLIVKKACYLLQEGHILGKRLQPHESHLPYILQFMIDYNLHGMSFISSSKVSYRTEESRNPAKISVCQAEGDIIADDILNKLSIDSLAANPGILAIWEDEKQRRRNKGDLSQISECLSLDGKEVEPTTTHKAMKALLIERFSSKDFPEKVDPNASVYPAESLDTEDLLNASSLDSHSSLQSMQNLSSISGLLSDTTIVNDSEDDFYDILNDLKTNKVDDKEEEDSILTQLTQAKEDESFEEIDMTLPLEDMDKFFDDFESSFISAPQIDGPLDSTSQSRKKQTKKSAEISSYDGPCDSSPDEDCSQNSIVKSYSQLSIVVQSPTRDLSNSRRVEKKRRKRNEKKDKLSTTLVTETIACKLKKKPEKISTIDETSSNSCYAYEEIISQQSETQKETVEKPITVAEILRKSTSETQLNKYSQASLKLFDTNNDNLQKINQIVTISECDMNSLVLSSEKIDTNTDLKKLCTDSIEKPIVLSSLENQSGTSNKSASSTKYKNICSATTDSNPTTFCSDNLQLDNIKSRDVSNEEITFTEAESLNLKLSNTRDYADSEQSIFNHDSLNTSQYTFIEADTTLLDNNSDVDEQPVQLWMPKWAAPTRNEVINSLRDYSIPQIQYQEPFYSNFNDVTGSLEVGTEVLKISSTSVKDCAEFKSGFFGIHDYRCEKLEMETAVTRSIMDAVTMSYCNSESYLITPVFLPPSREEVEKFLVVKNEPEVESKKEKKKILMPFSPGMDIDYDNSMVLTPCSPPSSADSKKGAEEIGTPKLKRKKQSKSLSKALLSSTVQSQSSQSSAEVPAENSCNITGLTLNNTVNFNTSLENLQNVKALNEHQYLTTIVMELHCQTRGNLKPDPTRDPIKAIFYLIQPDAPGVAPVEGAVILTTANKKPVYNINNVHCVETEVELFLSFIDIFKKYDPDICIGYEIEMQSWGYLVDRGYAVELNLVNALSRIVGENVKYSDDDDKDLKFTGRILLNLWRLMRHEIAVQSYTFENVVFHILHQRCPMYSYKDLSFWWEHPSYLYYDKVVHYYMFRLRSTVRIIDQLDLIGRTSELARLFGIQFYEVLSRGSQFRVESMMLRLAKPLNYIPVSPSVNQRAKMKAPEFLALILEPESKFYADPIIVLDFQSLYPSMIIAYNYCFTTCLGRIEHLGRKEPFEFGASQLRVNPRIVERLLKNDDLNFSPCGAVFVKQRVRKGVMPRMLEEILGTRLMVKKSMKMYKDDKILKRVLHSRQLGLKLIANVTYGYTAANFSGRMPLVELGDSVVSKGRETLYRAIKMVESNEKWDAKVVYGDTDSLFVMVKGRSKEQAFAIGEEIAKAVTDDNPNPVKLKLEKVYLPCILQTKKRYVGYMYESADQTQPDFEAKGIETVRRDGCPAVSKMLEKCLRILFESRNVSNVRKYVERQMNKILSGRISIQDLTFAKEYRGQSGYRPGACVPALELARKWLVVDKRSEPRSGERVPYVIINGPPGLPLIKLVRSPYELLNDPSLRLNALYYITKVIIPPINRCFTLIGADLHNWFKDLPRKQYTYLPIVASPTKRSTISQYFSTVSCAVCGQQTREGLCQDCKQNSQASMVFLQDKTLKWEIAYHETKLICQSCSGNMCCISLDCPVLYRLEQTKRDIKQVPFITELIVKNF